MATRIRFQLRRGQATEWRSVNPVLLHGEPGVETDTGKLKIGNGATSWNELPYSAGGVSAGDGGGAGSIGNLAPDPTDPGTFILTDSGGDTGPAAALPNTPFAVRFSGGSWEFTTLEAAKAAGLDERQTVWFIGNPTGAVPAWSRPGDVWTTE